MTFGICLVGIAFLLATIKKKSPVVTAIILLVLWVLMGFNTLNDDYVGYQYPYESRVEDLSGITKGYLAMERVGWALNLDFLQFRMLCSAIGLLLIASFVLRYSSCPNVVLALYMLLPFMYDIVQFKFFMAASVAIFSMRFLIDRTKFYGMKFVIGLCIAILIHPASLLFSFFLFGCLHRKTALGFSILLSFVIIFAVYSGIAQSISVFFMDSIKQMAYMTQMSRFGWIPYFISVILSVVITYFSTKQIHSDNFKEDGESRFLHFFESAQYAFLPLISLVPLSVQNFYRPIRSANLLFLICFVAFWARRSETFPKKERVLLCMLMIAWFIFTQIVLYRGVIDIVLIPQLSNNLLWG